MKHLHHFLLVAVVVMLAAPLAAFATQTPVRLTESEMKDLLKRIDKATERFRKTVNTALDKSALNTTQTEDHINRYIKDLEHYTDALKHHYGDSQTASATVEQVLARASNIEGFLQQHQLIESVTTDWGVLRGELDQLAAAYGVKWGVTGVAGVAYRVSEDQIEGLLSRIEHNAENFHKSLTISIEQEYNSFLKDFTDAAHRLESTFGDKGLAPGIVAELLQKAKVVDEHMQKYPQFTKAQADWALVRTDLEILAKHYGVNSR